MALGPLGYRWWSGVIPESRLAGLGRNAPRIHHPDPEYGIRSPLAFGGTGATLHLHVDNVDTLTERAREAGATVLREPTDYGHGERQSRLRDPFGHEWLLGHELEAISPEEIKRRFEAEGEAS